MNLPVNPVDQLLAVDWDLDGDLDLITLSMTFQLNLFEQGDDGRFVKKEPSPFDGVARALICLPAVVDVTGDSALDSSLQP